MNRSAKVWIVGMMLAGAVGRADEPAPITEHEAGFLANVRQATFLLPRAGEGYFSPDGKTIVYQAFPIGYPFYQIYLQQLDERVPRLLSTGRGRTTCAYFSPKGDQILFASSHTDPEIDLTEKKARDEAKQGGRRRYQWDFDFNMELYLINLDGTGLKRLTNSAGYDAEGSFSPDGKHIVFTSTRDGDPDLYIINADGTNGRQLTDSPGYDGGPFFSPDGNWVIFRSDRQKKDMLQIFAISVDGKTEVQLTDNLDHVNWCPFFHPSGKYFIWAGADYSQDPRAAHFDLWTMETEITPDTFTGTKVTRITDHKAQDVLPVFSPDGKKMMWTSSRTADGSSQLWIGDWKRTDDLQPTGDAVILPKDARLELLWNEGEFTEGVAVARNGGVYFSDIAIMAKNPGRIMKFDPKTKQTSVYVADSGQSNGLFFTADGRLIAACGANIGLQGLFEATADGKMKAIVDKFAGKKFNSPNDVVVHPKGWIYFSDPRYVGKEPIEIDHQSVYRVDLDGSVHRATTNITKPNGVIISPRGEFLYVAESGGVEGEKPRYTLNSFPVKENGTLGPKKVLVDFGDEMGIDGLTVDEQGHIYAAVRKPSRHGIVVYTPQGVEIAYIPTDQLPTNCTFGVGDEAKTLYVTAGEGLYRIPLNIPGYHPELSGK